MSEWNKTVQQLYCDPLHPDNHRHWVDQERVEVAWCGNADNVFRGTVIGLASQHVLDFWIVLLDEKPAGWEYRAVTVQHTFMRPEGANEPFLCEKRS
jgi:hypothetical protein